MRNTTIICLLVISGAFCAYSQNAQEQKKQDIAKLLDISNVSPQETSKLFDDLLSSLELNIPSGFESSFQTRFELKINDLKTTLINLYDEHFSHDEIKRLISFYESSVGQRYKAVTSSVHAEDTHYIPPQDTSEEKKKDVARLVKIKIAETESQIQQTSNITTSFVIDTMETADETAITTKELFKDVLELVANEEIRKIEDSLVLNFNKHFSHDEIKKLLRFFEGPLGKKLTNVTLLAANVTLSAVLDISKELAELPQKPTAPAKNENKGASVTEEISAQALASAPFLITDRDSKGYLLPGNGIIQKSKERSSYQIYDKVTVKLIGKTSYKLGDTVDVLTPVKLVPFKGKSAQIVSRSGRGVVTGQSGKNIVVQLVNMWGIITGGERVAAAAAFKTVEYSIAPQSDSNIQAAVVTRTEESASTYLSQFFIIDKGADAGINIGDFFKVFEKPSGDKLSDELLEGQVVNVGENYSTLVIRKIFKGELKAGDQAFLSRKSVLTEDLNPFSGL